MNRLNTIPEMSLYEFADYCKKVSDDSEKLEMINSYLDESIKTNKELAIYCLAFESITSNGIPNDEIEFVDSYYFDDLKDNLSDELAYEEHNTKHLILYVIEKLNLDAKEIIDNESKRRVFLNYLLAYFYFTVVKLVEHDDEELLASFIHSINSNSIDELNTDFNEFIYDEIIDCIKYVFNIDINDFKSEDETFTVTNYDGFTGSEITYDLNEISREIIDNLI